MSTTTTTMPADERQSGRHPVNVAHLVMGIAFLGLVGVWALTQGDVVGDGEVRWLMPVPWVLAGLAGLLAVGLSGNRRWSTRQTGWVGTDATAGTTAGTTAGAEPEAVEPEAVDTRAADEPPTTTDER
ncbi:MAG TPA: hypothetical protein VD864_08925 [Nocardioides sp.]|nr:hypothetical protein [Nocardioides sp.]